MPIPPVRVPPLTRKRKPEAQLIAITRPGGVPLAVMHFVVEPRPVDVIVDGKKIGAVLSRVEATDAAVNAEIARTFPGESVTWRRVAANALPNGRGNRDRWVDNGNAIVVGPPRP